MSAALPAHVEGRIAFRCGNVILRWRRRSIVSESSTPRARGGLPPRAPSFAGRCSRCTRDKATVAAPDAANDQPAGIERGLSPRDGKARVTPSASANSRSNGRLMGPSSTRNVAEEVLAADKPLEGSSSSSPFHAPGEHRAIRTMRAHGVLQSRARRSSVDVTRASSTSFGIKAMPDIAAAERQPIDSTIAPIRTRRRCQGRGENDRREGACPLHIAMRKRATDGGEQQVLGGDFGIFGHGHVPGSARRLRASGLLPFPPGAQRAR